MKLFLCFLLNFIIATATFSQEEIAFVIKDQMSNQAIESAFVFIENTSIGTITDIEGKATLPAQKDHFEIVITHLNYESLSIPSHELQAGENIFLLKEKILSLAEVQVRSKRVNARKRKKWIKKFEKAFLGTKTSRKKVKLLNPEVLWFEEQADTFKAHAVDNLKILNKETGYEMQFVLEDFTINANEDVRYAGKLFFKDIKTRLRKTKKIDQQREENYLQSQYLFFRSLMLKHPINQKRFEFGKTTNKEDGKFAYQKLTYHDLTWSFGPRADTLYLEDYLTVLINDLKLTSQGKGFNNKMILNRPVSFLKSKSGRFVIAHDGTLLNPEEVEESGHWTSFRMAKELPRNYQGSVVFNERSPKIIVDNLLDYQYRTPAEKVYLHTDRSQYAPYNTMWFKGYLVDAIQHTPQTESQVLYVDLINPKDEIIKTWILHKDKGLAGDYTWKRSDPVGVYRLRAYTNYMRNHGTDFFFEKEIELLNLSAKATTTKEASKDTLAVRFYPEGGDLIKGLSCNVVFQATNQKGEPQEIKGKIIDNQGTLIDEVKSVHRGFGQFVLKPEPNKFYQLLIEQEGETVQFELPNVLPSGLSLSVNSNASKNIYVSVAASQDALFQGAFLVGHVRGNIFCFVTNLENGQDIGFPRSEVPPGLLHFTLFDGQERPQAERLVFNDYAYEETLLKASIHTLNDTSALDAEVMIDLDSTILEEGIDLSMCIKSNMQVSNDQMDIKNYLLLESDITYSIPDKAYYLRELTNAKRYHLDLLLQSVYWRRFSWKDILQDSISIHYPAEQGYTISGATTAKEQTDPVQSGVMLTALGSTFFNDNFSTAKDGQFRFTNLPLFDSTTYIVQARVQNGSEMQDQEKIKMEGDRLLDIHIDDYSPVGQNNPRVSIYQKEAEQQLSNDAYTTLRDQYLQAIERDSSLWTIDAPEVNVRAKRPFTTNRPIIGKLIYLDNVDWVKSTARGTSLLGTLAPQRQFESGPEAHKLYSVFTNRQGQWVKVPIQIIINGIGAEPGGSNAAAFLGLSADNIESIYIGKTVVDIKTRKMPRSMEKYLKSGILYIDHPGYYQAREFSPDYTEKISSSFTSTLYWNPQVDFDEKGQVKYRVLLPASNGGYYIDLQGISASGKILYLREKLQATQ